MDRTIGTLAYSFQAFEQLMHSWLRSHYGKRGDDDANGEKEKKEDAAGL